MARSLLNRKCISKNIENKKGERYMNFNNFTIKSQEAVQQAVNLVQSRGQQAIEPEHLLAGVLKVGENVTNFIFQKLGVNGQQIETVLDKQIASLPKVSGGEPYLSRDANEVLQKLSSFLSHWVMNMFHWKQSSWHCLT